jgi:hypothetical protein
MSSLKSSVNRRPDLIPLFPMLPAVCDPHLWWACLKSDLYTGIWDAQRGLAMFGIHTCHVEPKEASTHVLLTAQKELVLTRLD